VDLHRLGRYDDNHLLFNGQCFDEGGNEDDDMVSEIADIGLVVVLLAEEVLVDVLAGGDLVDVPAEDVLKSKPRLDVHVCGLRLWVILGGDQAGVFPSLLQRESSCV
jgi:hypothetical protein